MHVQYNYKVFDLDGIKWLGAHGVYVKSSILDERALVKSTLIGRLHMLVVAAVNGQTSFIVVSKCG